MPKIKPFVWEKSSVANHEFAETPFGYYGVQGFGSMVEMEWCAVGIVEFEDENKSFPTIELAKRFAFDDFKRRLEETLGEPVGYDLEIDENC